MDEVTLANADMASPFPTRSTPEALQRVAGGGARSAKPPVCANPPTHPGRGARFAAFLAPLPGCEFARIPSGGFALRASPPATLWHASGVVSNTLTIDFSKTVIPPC